MADSPEKYDRKSRYTEGRGIAGAFEGETVTRRRLMEGTAAAVGGIATMAFVLPGLGFALGPIFEDTNPTLWQDVGAEADFNDDELRAARDEHRPGDRRRRQDHRLRPQVQPRHRQGDRGPGPAAVRRHLHPLRAPRLPGSLHPGSQKFVCPCHGGVYDSQGKVQGGPPVRPLDRFYTTRQAGRVEVGDRFSLNSQLERFSPRDPSNHLDGLWQYLYPSRPTT